MLTFKNLDVPFNFLKYPAVTVIFFSAKKPVYETAFVFIKDNYTDISVPPWAIKLILEPGDLARNQEEELEDDRSGQVILTEGGEREMTPGTW